MNVLQVNKLIKQYKKEIILNDISFKMLANEKIALIGLNGQGKTTLIKAILDLNTKVSGKVIKSKSCFYLPEKFNPSGNFTGGEYLKFLGTNTSLDVWGLPMNKKIKTYSKGMRQKLGLLAAFNSDSELLILDEPMSGLDLISRLEFRQKVSSFKGSILLTTHILEGLKDTVDSIIFLHSKNILLNKPVKDINFDELEEEVLKLTNE